MPKGQQRSNREPKKPKQPKKIPAAPSSSTVPTRTVYPVRGKNT